MHHTNMVNLIMTLREARALLKAIDKPSTKIPALANLHTRLQIEINRQEDR